MEATNVAAEAAEKSKAVAGLVTEAVEKSVLPSAVRHGWVARVFHRAEDEIQHSPQKLKATVQARRLRGREIRQIRSSVHVTQTLEKTMDVREWNARKTWTNDTHCTASRQGLVRTPPVWPHTAFFA